ncbi:MAG: citryl-CoA lyase [Calditrichia bacterium]
MASENWKTAITKIEPNHIVVRGYQLDSLMGKLTYPQIIYLLVKGELPTRNVGKILDAILVASVDHGVTPPSCQAAVTAASTGAPLNAALAAGILSINEFHGGAIEKSMRTLEAAVDLMKEKKLSLKDAATEIVRQYLDKQKKIMGYGHRVHTNDPRTTRLFNLAQEYGISGKYIEMSQAVGQALKAETGRDLPINVDGAIGAVLCELNMPSELANAFFIMARIPGLLAHIYEEKMRYSPMRKIDFSKAEYDGPAERKL